MSPPLLGQALLQGVGWGLMCALLPVLRFVSAWRRAACRSRFPTYDAKGGCRPGGSDSQFLTLVEFWLLSRARPLVLPLSLSLSSTCISLFPLFHLPRVCRAPIGLDIPTPLFVNPPKVAMAFFDLRLAVISALPSADAAASKPASRRLLWGSEGHPLASADIPSDGLRALSTFSKVRCR